MSYYMSGGDYYRGVGDGFWSKLGGGLAKVIKSPIFEGAMTMFGGPVAGAGAALAGAEVKAMTAHAQSQAAVGGADQGQVGGIQISNAMMASHKVQGIPVGSAAGPGALAMGGMGPSGRMHGTVYQGGKRFHYSKRTGLLVKGRTPRMNPLNVHALRRGIRRAHSFARIARSVVTFARHGHAGVKFKGHFGKRKRLR